MNRCANTDYFRMVCVIHLCLLNCVLHFCIYLYIPCEYLFPCMCFPFSVSINSRLASSLGNLYDSSDGDESNMTSSSSRTGFSVSPISSHLNGSLQLPHRKNHELNNNLYNRNSCSGNNLSSPSNFHSDVTDEYAPAFLYGPYSSSSSIPEAIPVSPSHNSTFRQLTDAFLPCFCEQNCCKKKS